MALALGRHPEDLKGLSKNNAGACGLLGSCYESVTNFHSTVTQRNVLLPPSIRRTVVYCSN